MPAALKLLLDMPYNHRSTCIKTCRSACCPTQAYMLPQWGASKEPAAEGCPPVEGTDPRSIISGQSGLSSYSFETAAGVKFRVPPESQEIATRALCLLFPVFGRRE